MTQYEQRFKIHAASTKINTGYIKFIVPSVMNPKAFKPNAAILSVKSFGSTNFIKAGMIKIIVRPRVIPAYTDIFLPILFIIRITR